MTDHRCLQEAGATTLSALDQLSAERLARACRMLDQNPSELDRIHANGAVHFDVATVS